MDKFVDEWNIIQTLGEGTFGEVKLLVHQKSNEAVAMKVVDLRKSKVAKECVIKEEKIHRLMYHPNIVRLLGKREEPNVVYIFMEYAAGGELFDKIEPDIGMSFANAQKYMSQLLAGLEYIHKKGIVHRDIKPENLLLDDLGNIKISDFGMATIFRLKGKERMLDKKCGTMPYVAPEVLEEPYRGEPADLWSCGIVFVAMLCGELPWDEPRPSCPEYLEWINDSYLTRTPWSKLDNTALSLAKKILSRCPKNRPGIDEILKHKWMNLPFSQQEYEYDELDSLEPAAKRQAKNRSPNVPSVTLSQPTPRAPVVAPERLAILIQNRNQICFSQPTQNDEYFVGSQLQCTQSPLTQNNFQKLTKRLTRFHVKCSYERAIAQLCKALDTLNYTWSTDTFGVVTISTVDARKMPLVIKANLINMDEKLLLDFRLSKGCGLEFKRRFVKIKMLLSEIIRK